METAVFRYLMSNPASSIIWLLTILAWLLWFFGIPVVGHWLLVSAITIFVLIMIIGKLKDRIQHLEKQLDRFRI